MSFNVGDKVIIKKYLTCFISGMERYKGKNATIIDKIREMNGYYTFYKLDIDDSEFNWTNDMLEPVTAIQEIHITTDKDGVTTHAILKENGKFVKRASARCHPEDEFDFSVGANIAVGRLFGIEEKKKEEKKYYTGKIVCVKGNYFFTKGKIYDVVEGKIKDNAKNNYYHYESLEDINDDFWAQFIELVE